MNDRRGTMAFSFRIWASGMPPCCFQLMNRSYFQRFGSWPRVDCIALRIPLGVPPKARDFCLCTMLFGVRGDGSSCARLEITAPRAVPCRFFSIENHLVPELVLFNSAFSEIFRLFEYSFQIFSCSFFHVKQTELCLVFEKEIIRCLIIEGYCLLSGFTHKSESTYSLSKSIVSGYIIYDKYT